MRYSVFAGGKRIRPILCLEAARIFEPEAKPDQASPAMHAACAIEFIHTYSLIHDDLPALDNDDLRRGKPTCHKQFGEATAILAGDGLLTLAFQIIGESSTSAERTLAILQEVSSAAGTVKGMVGGTSCGPRKRRQARRATNARVHSSFENRGANSGIREHRSNQRRRRNRGCRAASQFWRNDWLGLSGNRRHSGCGRIIRGSRQNCGQRYRATKGYLSGGVWRCAIARNRCKARKRRDLHNWILLASAPRDCALWQNFLCTVAPDLFHECCNSP